MDRERLERNLRESRKIRRLFTAAYYICISTSAIHILLCAVQLLAMLLTLGRSEPIFNIFRLALSVTSIFFFAYSHEQERKWTYASVILLMVMLLCELFGLLRNSFPIITFIQLIFQIICLTRYPAIERLKKEEGYPDFNPVCTVKEYSRRLYTDENIREMNEADNSGGMEEISMDDIGSRDEL